MRHLCTELQWFTGVSWAFQCLAPILRTVYSGVLPFVQVASLAATNATIDDDLVHFWAPRRHEGPLQPRTTWEPPAVVTSSLGVRQGQVRRTHLPQGSKTICWTSTVLNGVICALNDNDFVGAVSGKGIRDILLQALGPHVTLVAHPATLEPRTDNVQATLHTASFWENYW